MRIFLTGATGFLGRHLIARFEPARVAEVRCLVRDPARLPAAARVPGVTPVPGDLLGPPLDDAMRGCDVVVHLAARTGKAAAREFEQVNVEGTDRLLDTARRTGVPRFLHVSSIAVSIPDKRHDPCARSREAAEELVRRSGLDWAIVRPTLVLAEGSPAARELLALARSPVLPRFAGGRALVQPVHPADVVGVLLELLADERLGGRTIDVGGRDVLPIGDLLLMLRRGATGREGPSVPVPVAPLLPLLTAAEGPFLRWLPRTAGQLAPLCHDGIAAAGVDLEAQRRRLGVNEILAEVLGHVAPGAPRGAGEIRAEPPARPSSQPVSGPPAPPPAAPRPTVSPGPPPSARRLVSPLTPEDRGTLADECDVLVRHLTGAPAAPYVRTKYVQAHEPERAGPLRSTDDEDDILVELARRGPRAARLADHWAALFDRGGPLRRKLVLLVAILESGRESESIDCPDPGGLAAFVRATAGRLLVFAGMILAAAVVVGPRWLLAGRGDDEAGDA